MIKKIYCNNRKHKRAIRNKSKRAKLRASMIIEASLIIPFLLLLTFWMLRIGILIYDANAMDLTVQEQVRNNLATGKNWDNALAEALEKRMFEVSPLKISQIHNREYLVQMKIGKFWMNRVIVRLPRDNKTLLYHFVNAKQLTDHIPALQEAKEKYFKELEKIKKD